MIMLMKCASCGKIHNVKICLDKNKYVYKGVEIEAETVYYHCENSDDETADFIPPNVMDDNLERIKRAYYALTDKNV